MRIIIKPMGFALIVASVLVLSALIFLPMAKGVKLPGIAKTTALNVSLTPNDPDHWQYVELASNAGTASIVPLTDGPNGNQKAEKLTVQKPDPATPWHVQTFRVLSDSFGEGQELTVRFWARSVVSKSVQVVFEQNFDPYAKDLSETVSITPEWKQYSCTFKTTRSYAPSQSKLGFQVGASVGDFEFTGVELVIR